MCDILQIIGTRPQYEKLIRFNNDYVIDTGQHYSKELVYDKGKVNITNIWTGSIKGSIRTIEEQCRILKIKPKLIIVYGDTFSTFIGALVAKRNNIPLCHIEAGVRVYDDSIEERIRKKVDSLSNHLLCPTKFIYEMMAVLTSGIKIYFTGDLMLDRFKKEWVKIRKAKYTVMTIHRRQNMDRLDEILDLCSMESEKIRFYIHPHTEKIIKEKKIKIPDNIKLYKPISYKKMLKILLKTQTVITDSGGLIREATWAGCYTVYIGCNPWEKELEVFGKGFAELRIDRFIKNILREINEKEISN